MSIKCDLHVHSKYSAKPTNWITQKFGVPESFTEPEYIYKTAKEKGMTHVTITDHNKITGALQLSEKYDDAFVSCEVTAIFPEDNCKCHILTYDITEKQYNELMRIRKNIYDTVSYLNENGISHALAHPFYGVSSNISQWHFERFLLMFDLFELNGFRSTHENNTLVYVINSLDNEIMQLLYEKHEVGDKIEPTIKGFIRGSDDHSGIFIGKNYTKNSGSEIKDFFKNTNLNSLCGYNATPKELAYAIYSVGYQHLNTKFDLYKYVDKNTFISTMHKFLTTDNSINGKSFLYKLFRPNKANKLVDNGDTMELLFKIIENGKDMAVNLNTHNIADKWFDLTSNVINEATKDLIDYLLIQIESGNFFNIFKSLGSLSALYFLIVPYYVSYFIFQDTKKFSQSINIENRIITNGDKLKVAHFTDTFNETNGVAVTLRQTAACAQKYGYDYTFLTCGEGSLLSNEIAFKPVKTYDLPEYPELKLPCPPIIDIIDYCYNNNFTYIHSATPGAMGLVALLIAKIFQKPLFSTYHTAFPQYIKSLTQEKFMEGITWQYMLWYYGQCDLIFARSEAFKQELIENGLDGKKIIVMPKGVDTGFYIPDKTKKANIKKRLLYLGRISKEKGLDVLAKAFKLLDDTYELYMVGDGPYKEELQKELQWSKNVYFTGYLYGNDLLKHYQQADLFVFPSTSDTMGNVILEAHACGLPTIVTNKGGPQENVIDKKTGFVIEGNDEKILAKTIENVFCNYDLSEMGRQCRKVVEKYSFDKAFLDWMEQCDNYLNGRWC